MAITLALLVAPAAGWSIQDDGSKRPAPAIQEKSLPGHEDPRPQAPEVPGDPGADPDLDSGWLLLSARAGAWLHPEFEARTALGSREIKRGHLAMAGLELGWRSGPWSAALSFDTAAADDVTAWLGGARLGASVFLPVDDYLAVPLEAGISAGVLGGRLEVDQSGFGDFDPAWGFLTRGDLSAWLSDELSVSLWAEYRHIEFEYDREVLSGNRYAIGPSVALGISMAFLF